MTRTVRISGLEAGEVVKRRVGPFFEKALDKVNEWLDAPHVLHSDELKSANQALDSIARQPQLVRSVPDRVLVSDPKATRDVQTRAGKEPDDRQRSLRTVWTLAPGDITNSSTLQVVVPHGGVVRFFGSDSPDVGITTGQVSEQSRKNAHSGHARFVEAARITDANVDARCHYERGSRTYQVILDQVTDDGEARHAVVGIPRGMSLDVQASPECRIEMEDIEDRVTVNAKDTVVVTTERCPRASVVVNDAVTFPLENGRIEVEGVTSERSGTRTVRTVHLGADSTWTGNAIVDRDAKVKVGGTDLRPHPTPNAPDQSGRVLTSAPPVVGTGPANAPSRHQVGLTHLPPATRPNPKSASAAVPANPTATAAPPLALSAPGRDSGPRTVPSGSPGETDIASLDRKPTEIASKSKDRESTGPAGSHSPGQRPSEGGFVR